MAIFFQQIINALAIGGIYALMSVGYALIYSLLMFTNFAHSVAVTFGSYAMYLAMTRLTSNFYLGMFAGVIAGAAVALIIEITSYKPLLIKNSARSSLTIIGLGISTIGTNAIILVSVAVLRLFQLTSVGRAFIFWMRMLVRLIL